VVDLRYSKMTIKQLLGFNTTDDPVEVLERMTQEELLQHCAPYIRVVELKEKEEPKEPKEPKTKASGKSSPKTASDWLLELERLKARHGITNVELPKEIKKI